MKKWKIAVTSILSLVLAWFLLSWLVEYAIGVGCANYFKNQQDKERKWLDGYMSKIAVDITGYELCDPSDGGAVKVENVSGEYTVQGVELTLFTTGRDYFEITFNDTTLVLDAEFINARTEVYSKINSMWSEYDKTEPPTCLMSRVEAVTVYEDKLYIFTNGITANLWGGCRGQYPTVMYQYDILTDEFFYLGYYYLREGNAVSKGLVGFKYDG